MAAGANDQSASVLGPVVANRSATNKPGWPPRQVVRNAAGLSTLETALGRAGLGPVAGIDEAGRGACAGPMMVAACILPARIPPTLARLDDSKKLTEAAREELYPKILTHSVSWSVVSIPAPEIDRIGLHVANIVGMRRAVAGLQVPPGYVLIDGFTVPGLGVPSLPVIGGDAAAACIAAASVLAKVTRDRVMTTLDAGFPGYGFAVHKGYSTATHMRALSGLGPSSQHRMRYQNVRAALFEGLGRPAAPLSSPADGGALRLAESPVAAPEQRYEEAR